MSEKAYFFDIDKNQEEQLSKQRCYHYYKDKLYESQPIGTLAHMQDIHHYIFEEVYDIFAGKLRESDINREIGPYCRPMYIEGNGEVIGLMPQSTFEEIVRKYVEMHWLHPFYEGNRRTARVWLDNILTHELGQRIDWSRVSKDLYKDALNKSYDDHTMLQAILKNALTDQIDDKALLKADIDASYAFDNLSVFRTDMLVP